MPIKPALMTFHVGAKIAIDTVIEISAATLEDAVAKSKELEIKDFIEIHGDYNGSNMRITGVFETHQNQISI